ncbi:MAG: hypothetical protein CEN90_395 [Parcubacteria group bacterium Licking1014_17]|nr:MAG: hypothetical protein CEN90_395 [Parcubacteria group bacterium Licking1014_17]
METITYELGYHLQPDMEETEVRSSAQKLQEMIIRYDGSIVSSSEPKRTHLSYQIKHKNYARFGTFDFTAPADSIEKINSEIKLQNHIIRHIIIKKEGGKELKTLGIRRAAEMPLRQRQSIRETPAEPAQSEQQIEKELEKVIEGL